MLRMICLFGAFGLGAAVVSSVEIPGIPARPGTAGITGTGAEPGEFRGKVLATVNEMRAGEGIAPVSWDGGLESCLARFLRERGTDAEEALEALFDAVQREIPAAQYLEAKWTAGASRAELLGTMREWEGARGAEFCSFAAGKIAGEGGGFRILALIAGKMRPFSPEAVNEEGGFFYQQCPHCRGVHALELERKPRMVVLSCPDCGDPTGLLAADTRGKMRRAPDFFTGFHLPEQRPGNLAQATGGTRRDLDGVLAVWRQVAERCRYEADGEIRGRAGGEQAGTVGGMEEEPEIWKTPEETWRDRRGDCEDTSLLLADALISAGYRARVAVGQCQGIGPHAWCVVEVDGEQYLLESTLDGEIGRDDLVTVAEAAREYRPAQIFDRDHLYVRAGNPEEAGGDCFRESGWKALAGPGGL